MSNEKITDYVAQGNYVDFKNELKKILDDELGNELRTRFANDSENENSIEEKSVSQQQQKLMGIAYAIKKGEMDPSDATEDARKIADQMSMKELKKFASTPHKGLPVKKN